MSSEEDNQMIQEYKSYLEKKEFACIAAKASLAKGQIKFMVAHHLSCPANDLEILDFLYQFIDGYREAGDLYHSAAVIFKGPEAVSEEAFDGMLWQRLQALSDLDAQRYPYDTRVSDSPTATNFSFSLKGEACYIVGLHPGSSRLTRQFAYPTLVFNPHAQFEQLRESAKYDNIKGAVRKRDLAYSGSVNPMLEDFGTASEVFQYSGRQYGQEWECPLKINHGRIAGNTAA